MGRVEGTYPVGKPVRATGRVPGGRGACEGVAGEEVEVSAWGIEREGQSLDHSIAQSLNKKRPVRIFGRGVEGKPGDDLLSRWSAVSSARAGLTAVFGMGTGVALPLWSPEYQFSGEGKGALVR